MPTNTYTPIASVTLSATASEVVFSGLPQTFRDLIVVVSAANSTNDITWSMTFNNDSGANYSYVLARGFTSTSAQSQTLSGQTAMFIAGWSFGQGTSNQTPLVMQLMDYSATDKHKTMLNRFQTQRNDNSNEVGMLAGRWASNNAITSVRIFPNSSTFASGSTFTLFGIAG
jgi:hypothetical protein